VTGYAHDDAGNLVYLGMVGHKTVLESIRATIQARQRKKLWRLLATGNARPHAEQDD
jgi:hypothetical protein